MLILPPGHIEVLRARRRLTPRERRIIGGLLAGLVALAVVIAISFGSSAPTSSHGCIRLTVAAATGASQIDQCGATARDTCASVNAPGAYASTTLPAVRAACRKAGLPVGP